MSKLISTMVTMGLAGSVAWGAPTPDAPEYEVVCRMKAKEIAADTYRSCVTDARTTQIEQLKKDYQDRLRTMKDEYQRELKKLSAGKNQNDLAVEPVPAAASGKKKISKRTGKLPLKTATAKTSKPESASVTTITAPSNSGDSNLEEMTVQLKSPGHSVVGDESSLDLPEPTAIEEVPTADTRY